MTKPTLRLIVASLFLLTFGLSFRHASPVSAQTGESVRAITLSTSGYGQALAVAFSPDGNSLAVGSSSGIYLFDTQKLSAIDRIQTNAWVRSVAFLPGSNTLAAGLFDKTIKLWRMPKAQLTSTFEGHQGWVWSISVSRDGTLLASASDDNTVRVWTTSGVPRLVLDKNTTGVRAVALSPDGKLVAAALEDKTVRIWGVEDGELLYILVGHTAWVRCLAFSPDGSLLASGSFDKTVRLWNVSDGKLLQTMKGHTASVLGVAFSPDGTKLASGSVDQTVRLWRVSDGTLLNILQGHTDFVYAVAFSPDGKTLASGGADNTVCLWDLEKLPAESSTGNDVQLPATPSDCRVCHHSRGLGQPPRVIELRCEGCHTNGASLEWCPAFSRSPEAVTPPVSYTPYSGHAGVPVGGSDVSVLIVSPSNGETLYAGDGITAPAYVVGQVHSATSAATDLQVQLTVWSGNQNTATLTTTPSPTGQFKFNLSINPQGGIPVIKPGGTACVPCHADYRAQAPMPNGDVRLIVTVNGSNGLQASDERWIKVDASEAAILPVEVVDALTHQPLPGLSIQASTVLYEWRSRFGNAVTEQNGVAQLLLNQLSQAPTLYTVNVPPTVYHGKLYSSDQPILLTLTPGETSYPTVTLSARTQTGQLAGIVTGASRLGALIGTKIWAVQLPTGPAYSVALDAQDKFSFSQIPVSQYVVLPDPLSLSQYGLSTTEQNVDLVHSPQASTAFSLTKSVSISGTVSASNGVSLPFAWSTVGEISEAYAVDPATGSFLIPEFPSGAGYLTVSAPGYYSHTQHITDSLQSQDFQLVARPETQRMNWGNGYLIIPPETESTISDLSISLDRGWLWGEGGASQPLTITLPIGRVTILNAGFALEYPVDDTGWLYIRKGSAQVILNGDQAPVINVGSGQMVALVSGAQPIPAERTVVLALHPVLAEAPISEVVEPSMGAQVQNWLEKAGIGVAQTITLITYILSLVTLFTTPLFVLFWYWKKRRNLSSSEEKH